MKSFFYILCMFCILPLSTRAQSYKSLWNQVDEAANKDLPKTVMEKLQLIISKAEKKKDYGQLLKATLLNTQTLCQVTPDSLKGELVRFHQKEQEAKNTDPVLAAVWQTVLGCIYRDNPRIDEDPREQAAKSQAFFDQALSNPQLLASTKASEYVPLIEEGYDGRWFGNDLLSVIGYEIGAFDKLHDYYKTTSLRTAACLTACEQLRKTTSYIGYSNKSDAFQAVDSLISEYGDIKVAGELAVLKYEFIKKSYDLTKEDEINFINYALSKWGDWPRTNILRNAEKKLTQPQFYLYFGDKWNLPGRGRAITRFNSRNISKITMTISRTSLDASEIYHIDDDKVYAMVKSNVMPLEQYTQTRHYTGQPAYKTIEDSLEIPPLPIGMYLVELTTDNKDIKTERILYNVSDVQALAFGLPNEQIRYVVVSATTGQPLPNAKLRLSLYDTKKKPDERKREETLICDDNGEVVFEKGEQVRVERVFAYTEEDKYCPDEYIGTYFNYNDRYNGRQEVSLFCDRAIYRPGQKVHVALIAYDHDGHIETKALESRGYEITLLDANGKKVDSKKVVTDAFGKASAEFQLPENGLTGIYTVKTDRCRIGIRVEQYKRPTFEITFPEVHETYQAGDTVLVKGRAMTYSGVPVQDAEVKYTVKRTSAWWWYRSENKGETLLEREAKTDEDGYFVIEMPMLLPEGASSRYSFYQIIADVKVTDSTGETHEGETSLPLGSRSTVLVCNMPDKIERDSLKTIRFDYKNMAGSDIEAEVRYTIDNSPKVYVAPTNKTVPLGFDPNTIGSGTHLITASCGTDTVKVKFLMFSLDDQKPCEKTSDWFYTTSGSFPADGSPVSIQVGTSDPDTHVLYSIISGDSILDTGSFELSDEIFTMKFSYKEEYGDGLLLNYAWVKEGKTYQHTHVIKRPLPDKRLNLQFTTFRDRLVPGKKEQWTLKVTNPDGSPADAQVLAALYDKSLDQLVSHNWIFNPTMILRLPSGRWSSLSHPTLSMDAAMPYNRLTEPELKLSKFVDDIFFMGPSWGRGLSVLRSAGARYNEVAMAEAEPMMLGKALNDNMEAETPVETVEESESNKGGEVQMRENFDETAFFMPSLQADEKGNVLMKFTLPESVTTWRFISLATDKDMNHGNLTAEAIAQKDVMVQPNMPRFLRTGDKATISARISNTTEKKLLGKATLTLIDPETEKTVYTQSKNYTLDGGQTDAVTFDVTADGKTDIYVCRVVVSGKGYSDGEQHFLPVLPDHEMVLRTYPFTQHGPGRVSLKLDKLFAEGIKDGKLTIEYTNNPAWLVVQSLPSLARPVYDDLISQAASFYSNSIGNYIFNLTPAIRENVKAWQEELGKETSLNSNLQKNEELKDLVLNETPWVRVAEREEAQKRDLIKYFDESLLKTRIQDALYKIKKLQNEDGSWSWWPGMYHSTYLTAATAEILVRVNHMIGTQRSTTQMVTSSFEFLGNYLIEEMKELKKAKKEKELVRPSETAIQIMYIFALDGREQPSKVKSAQKYLIELLSQQACDLTIYGKAIAAVIFHANKEKKLAQEYVESISQYSVMTEEMGRYFDTPHASYSWRDYKIPTEVAAIEAYKRVRPEDEQSLEEMRRWLLQEKRSHIWSTNINTVDAAYAFLDGNISALDNGDNTRFTLNGKNVKVSEETAGLGYVKTTVNADGNGAFAAEKTSQGTSWGALYAQFEQKSIDVEASSSQISVKREIIGPKDRYKVGDKVKVRITIKAERDLDFVQVVDRRAACMEPASQLSGYRYGYYCAPQDNQTCYFFDRMAKGTHVVETVYYLDRAGTYDTGTCRAQCSYAPEYEGTAPAFTLVVEQ